MNFNQLLKQAQQMQKKVNKFKKEYEEKTFDFESQQGLIKGQINGKLEIVQLDINPELLAVENKDMLQDLLTVTLNEIMTKTSSEKEDALNKITNGVDVSAFL